MKKYFKEFTGSMRLFSHLGHDKVTQLASCKVESEMTLFLQFMGPLIPVWLSLELSHIMYEIYLERGLYLNLINEKGEHLQMTNGFSRIGLISVKSSWNLL